MSMTFLIKEEKLIEPRLSMPELAQETRRTIYPIRLNTLENDIRITNSLKISEAVSTSNEKDLTPYWNESRLEMSRKLLSRTGTDFAGSDLNLSAILQNRTTANSWFSTTHNSPLKQSLFKTLFPLSTFSLVEFTDSANTLIRSRKIRIYPKSEDIKQFKKYCDLTRYWYNKTIEYLRQDGTVADIKKIRSIIQSRENNPEWSFDSPQRIREYAISDACNAVKNAKKKFMVTHRFQEVSFKRKKNPKQSFGFDKKSLTENYVFTKKIHKIFFYSTEEYKTELEGCRIYKENNRWFLIIPEKIHIKKPENQRFSVVALDPGVRTFMSYYSDSCYGKVGESDFSRIYRLCIQLDNAISKRSKSDYNSKRRISKAICRLRWKIKDSINEIHHKFASFLVKNFDTVLIPTFETSEMVTKLRSKTARSMLTWAHYRFKQFLKFKGKEYSCKIIEVNEAYTSKTCSYCGKIHNIGSKKVMKCSCGANVDRDLNGARGIYLRNLI